MLQRQRRTDGVERKLRRHGVWVDRIDGLLGPRAADLQRAGGDQDAVEAPVSQRLRRRRDARLIGEVEPIGAAAEPGDAKTAPLQRRRQRRANAARGADDQSVHARSPPEKAPARKMRASGGQGYRI